MPGISARRAPRRAAAASQAGKSRCMHGRARPPGACTMASPATLVLPALSSLSCSRDSHTRRAAFLVVKINCGQKLVATGSLEQALISSMGGLLISRGRHRQKTADAPGFARGHSDGTDGLMAQPQVVGERPRRMGGPGEGWGETWSGRRPRARPSCRLSSQPAGRMGACGGRGSANFRL